MNIRIRSAKNGYVVGSDDYYDDLFIARDWSELEQIVKQIEEDTKKKEAEEQVRGQDTPTTLAL